MQKLPFRWWTPGATAGMALSLCLPLGAHAAWPERPVKIIVGFAAGGRLATDSVAKAEPDGYTLALLVGGDAVPAASALPAWGWNP